MTYTVVITGSSRGIGLALAVKFLELGDNVVISARHQNRIDQLVIALRSQFNERIVGKAADVTDYQQVESLATFAVDTFGKVDIWINNAGLDTTKRKLLDEIEPSSIQQTISTNVVGTLYGCRAALNVMKGTNGRIFNMSGMGDDGKIRVPGTTVYGTSKRAIPYIATALTLEYKDTDIKISTFNPGMVVTHLLLSEGNTGSYWAFNAMGEAPETVAEDLVPKLRASQKQNDYVSFIPTWKMLWRMVNAKRRRYRLIDAEGNLTFTPLEDKLLANTD